MIARYTIFLDFDGVLVTRFSTVGIRDKDDGVGRMDFDPVCMENLRRFIENVKREYQEVAVVVISNWRYDLDDEMISKLLTENSTLAGCLSRDYITCLDRIYFKSDGIQQYIREHNLSPHTFIILDDEFVGEELAAFQIRPRSEDGIRELDFDLLSRGL